MTNASVTSRGTLARVEPARHSRAKCSARSEESCAEHILRNLFSPINPNLVRKAQYGEGGGATKKQGTPLGVHPEGSLALTRELNSPRSSRASTERPFVEFANRIPCYLSHGQVRWSGGATKKARDTKRCPLLFWRRHPESDRG